MAESSEKDRKVPHLQATLADLFRARSSDAPACDACGDELSVNQDADEGFAVAGKGVYLSSRGGDVRYEDVPLCPACGSAIGLSALRQWEIEEEEG